MFLHLLSQYGYLFVLIGTFFEGEVVLAIAGFVARDHVIHLPFIMLAGFLGSLAGDQFFFWLGRLRGREYLLKRPHFQENADRVHELLHKYKYLVMSGFRFLYGFRVITPIVIGTSEVSHKEFTLFNVLGAAVWSVVVTLLGYTFGTTLELFIRHFRRYEEHAILFIILVCVGLWISSSVKKHLRYRKKRAIMKKL